jgi:hypothetical protein
MRIEEGALRRVDLQLLAMIDNARERLSDGNRVVPESVLLNGFSASAAFVNRFTVLHPERVCSVSAGGVNGIVTLPVEENEPDSELEFAAQLPPNYPVGVADVSSLTGEPFDEAAFGETNQFVYMGEDDSKVPRTCCCGRTRGPIRSFEGARFSRTVPTSTRTDFPTARRFTPSVASRPSFARIRRRDTTRRRRSTIS